MLTGIQNATGMNLPECSPGFSLPECLVSGSLLPTSAEFVSAAWGCCRRLLPHGSTTAESLYWAKCQSQKVGTLMRKGQTFCRACGKRTRGKGFKLKAERFKLGVGKTFFRVKMVKQQNRLQGEMVGAPSLKHSRSGWTGLWEMIPLNMSLISAGVLDLMTFKCPFWPKPLCGPMANKSWRCGTGKWTLQQGTVSWVSWQPPLTLAPNSCRKFPSGSFRYQTNHQRSLCSNIGLSLW